MGQQEDYNRAMQILSANADKTFVKRILTPEKFPKLDLGRGQYATHKMSWVDTEDANGNPVYHVFPTVLYDGKQLKDYGDQAYDHARETGNYIEFKNPQEADWFSRRYKAVWGEQE
jgi:hypothetical protein